MNNKLAIEGGTPVRERPLPPPYPGALVMGDEEKQALCEVIDHKSPFRYYGLNVLGKVKDFERSLEEYLEIEHALGVTSGTAALKVALVALGIGPGDEVIMPAYTFLACVSAVAAVGAIPVFAEIDESLNLDPADLAARITPRTRAVMPVHFQGIACAMDPILAMARQKGLAVIEDCAQSFGCEYQGRKIGTLGDIAAFSLQMNKVITSGEGGAVVTGNQELHLRAVRYHDHGNLREEKGGAPSLGENYRMSELTGAVAGVQLRKIHRILDPMKRAKKEILAGIRDLSGLTFRRLPPGAGDIGASVIFLTPSASTAERFAAALTAENIGADQIYGGTVYEAWPQVLLAWSPERGSCPATGEIARRLVHIPLGPTFGPREIADVIAGVRKVASALL